MEQTIEPEDFDRTAGEHRDRELHALEVDYAKSGRSQCKNPNCDDPRIGQGTMRLGRSFKRPDGVIITTFYHPKCLLDVSKRAKSWSVTEPQQLHGYESLKHADQSFLADLIKQYQLIAPETSGGGQKKGALGSSASGTRQATLFAFMGGGKPSLHLGSSSTRTSSVPVAAAGGGSGSAAAAGLHTSAAGSADVTTGASGALTFSAWCDAMEAVGADSSLTAKQGVIRAYLSHLADATRAGGLTDDDRRQQLYTALRLCLPKEDKRVLRIKDRTLTRVLPEILNADSGAFAEDVKASGDVGEAAERLFQRIKGGAISSSSSVAPLTLVQVDAFLDSLTCLSKDVEQRAALAGAVHRCSSPRELKWLVRLIKKDLRIGAQAAQFLPCLAAAPASSMSSSSSSAASADGAAAWEEYRRGADLKSVVDRYGAQLLGLQPPPSAGGGGSSGATSSSAALAGGVKRKRASKSRGSGAVVDDDEEEEEEAAEDKELDEDEEENEGDEYTPAASSRRREAAPAAKRGRKKAKGGDSPAAVVAAAAAAPSTTTTDEAAAIVAEEEDNVGGVEKEASTASEEETMGQQPAGAAAGGESKGRKAAAGASSSSSSAAAAGGYNDGAREAEGEDEGEDELDAETATAAAHLHPGVPLKPMLAEAVTSIDAALARCKGKVVAEIKYDGNRVQIHKAPGPEAPFQYWSRSLKPMKGDQVEHITPLMRHALPSGDSVILDGEVLLVSEQGAMLAFGSLGTEERKKYGAGAHPCLFVFDILYLNGASLLNKPWTERRSLLEKVLRPLKHHIELSRAYSIESKGQLTALMQDAIDHKLEGLMVKDGSGAYEPNRRRWVKLKRDHLGTGMADSVDLVVLGSYLGKGAYGGLQSVWLLGCWDARGGRWRTVAKVGNGMSDADTRRYNNTLPVRRVKTASDVPGWLDVKSPLRPDFVVIDPWRAPVWEVTGFELTASTAHTSGVSIRFPRLTRERSDKGPKDATSLHELINIKKASGPVSDGGAAGVAAETFAAELQLPSVLTSHAQPAVTLQELGISQPKATASGGAASSLTLDAFFKKTAPLVASSSSSSSAAASTAPPSPASSK